MLLESDSRWYLRVALDGMVFAGDVTHSDEAVVSVQGLEVGNTDDPTMIDRSNRNAAVQVFSGGDKGSNSVVFRVRYPKRHRRCRG